MSSQDYTTEAPYPNLHDRIAEALGWTEKEVKSFSLLTLREVVRPVSSKLAHELGVVIQSGEHIARRVSPRKRRW